MPSFKDFLLDIRESCLPVFIYPDTILIVLFEMQAVIYKK